MSWYVGSASLRAWQVNGIIALVNSARVAPASRELWCPCLQPAVSPPLAGLLNVD